MLKAAQKVLLVIFSFFIFHFSFFISPVSAQAPNPYATPNINPDVPNNLHTWTQSVMIEVMAAATCQIAGVDPVNPNQKCLGVDPQTNSIGFVPSAGSGQAGGGGAIGLMGNLIALTYTPPLHTGDYFSYLAQNFGIAKPAFAQVTGFSSLKPLMGLWVAFRNIVYLLFVLVFVIVGVAIMLRVKIDPRTVMTIENQIPKIIVGLLLVTFSFAIAGFLIDLMWVSIYLIIGIIASAGVTLTPAFQNFQGLNPLEVANNLPVQGPAGIQGILGITLNAAGSIKDILESFLFTGPVGTILGGIIGGIIGHLIQQFTPVGTGIKTIVDLFSGTPVASGIAKAIGDVVFAGIGAVAAPMVIGWFTSFIAFLIIGIAVLTALIRLWFELIKAYIFILIDVVFAPFFIVAGLFPGSPIGFGAWLRDILANLSAFPVTIGMFLLGKVFIDNFGTTQTNQFVPPLIGNPSSQNVIGALIGLGIILMTPQVVNMMKELFKSPQFKYGAAVGQAIGTGTGVFNVPGHASSLGQTVFGLSRIPGIGGLPYIGKWITGKEIK